MNETISVEPIINKIKRGRKSKKMILESEQLVAEQLIENKNNIEFIINEKYNNENTVVVENTIIYENIFNLIEQENEHGIEPRKKRGRKPKGGKIIKQLVSNNIEKEEKPNIILHLKCAIKDLEDKGDHNSNFTTTNIDAYNFLDSKVEMNYEIIEDSDFKPLQNYIGPSQIYEKKIEEDVNSYNNTIIKSGDDDNKENREIWRKLKILEQNLHLNNVLNKKSACFWCSYDFDNPSIFIPKHFIKNTYHVYGCFCSPECSVAYLMKESINSSIKFERYHLINHIYSNIYNYKNSIKPAPDPHYMLEKFYGTLSIQEYRILLKSDRLFLIIDKPLTRILPEFHEDNEDFIINHKIIPSNNYQVKKIQKKQPQTKNSILNETFGLN